jgi:hypothetical protein
MIHDTDEIINRLERWCHRVEGVDWAGELHEELRHDLGDAIAHFQWLRSMVGAVSHGESHADLKARLVTR